MTSHDDASCDSPKSSRVSSLARAAVAFVVVMVIGLGLVYVAYDRHLVEKMLTYLALPPGLMALALLFATCWAWAVRQQGAAVVIAGLLVFFCFTSNSLTANLLGGSLEGRYPMLDPTEAPEFDLIIVLGGGVKVDLDDNAWLGSAGDRLMLAARLYQLGKVKHLIATGSTYRWSGGGGGSYARATQTVWTQLGIPESAITTVDGLNTSRELANLRKLFDEGSLPYTEDDRIGLLTSATHLPRAERLARAAGFSFEPIAADFQVPLAHPFPLAMIPNSTAIGIINLSWKEFLARLVNR